MTDDPPKRPLIGPRRDDRDFGRPKTNPFGVPLVLPPREPESWEGPDGLTPVTDLLPDPIEVAATRIAERTEAIRERPGPTPAPEALQSAITIHGVRAELHEFKRDVKEDIKGLKDKVENVAGVVLTGMAVELDRRREQEHLMMRRTTEVGTAADIAKLEIEAAREKTVEAKKKTRAETLSKLVIFGLAVCTAALGLIQAGKC